MELSRVGSLMFALISGLACSPNADPIGKGNAHYQVAYSTVPDAPSCGLTSVGGIGSPDPPSLPSGDGQVSNFGEEVVDGQSIGKSGEYIVECTVTKGGRIEVEMEGANTSPSAQSGSGETALSITGSIDKDTGMGSATVTVRTTESGPTTSKPGVPCNLTAVQDDDGDFMIAEGEAKFTFVCPEAVSSQDPFGVCETRGAVSVRSCMK